MILILSKYLGPCYGVSNAFNSVMSITSNAKVLGDIAHNSILMEKIKTKKNINTIRDIHEISRGDIVVTRTHGITLEELESIKEKKCQILDQTCIKVKNVHKIAEKSNLQGKKFILIGDKKHPEVVGIVSRCKNATVVDSLESAKILLSNVQLNQNVVVASQTTFDEVKFLEICEFIKKKFPNSKIYNTICNDSMKRREEIIKISGSVDIVLVIGSLKSSNSVRLFEVAKKIAKEALILENPKELDFEKFILKNKVFITSGASVLKETALEFIDKIFYFCKKNSIEIDLKESL